MVTSFLVCLIRNTEVPIGFSFCYRETSELYELLYTACKDNLSFDISCFDVISDMGKGLRAFCVAHSMCQFICLRHFLIALKRKPFSFQVGLLVKAKNHSEFVQTCYLVCEFYSYRLPFYCECPENLLYNQMFRFDFKCSHIYYLEKRVGSIIVPALPDIPQLKKYVTIKDLA